MGNCATFTSDIYTEIRSCNFDPNDPSAREKSGPLPYKDQHTMGDYNFENNQIRESHSLDESEIKEDPYMKYLKRGQEKHNLNMDEVEEKVLDFKMLSVRDSLNSMLSESFMKEKTKGDVAEMTVNEEKEHENNHNNTLTEHRNSKKPTRNNMTTEQQRNHLNNTMTNTLQEQRSQFMNDRSLNAIDQNAEPMQPMNRDKVGNSFMISNRTLKSPQKGQKGDDTKEDKNILDNSSLFISPFKKPNKSMTTYRDFKENMQPKPLNNVFFSKTLQYLGPFDYTLKEDFLSQNPSYRDFLQTSKNLPISEPRKLENQATYIGQWLNGQKHGRGKQIWPDGSFYEGYWYQNQAHGKGRLIHCQGTVYEGYWALDQAHGQGLYFTVEGSFYQGSWYEDKQHGFGVEKWGSGASYEGDYFMGMKHGKGTFKWEDGSWYQGEFQENLIQGKGKYQWNDGREYDGEWMGNKMHGKGVFKWPDGRIYSGNYEHDEKNGIGVFFWPDGSLYKGFWMEGNQHGRGKFIGKDGSVREGNWRNGKLEG